MLSQIWEKGHLKIFAFKQNRINDDSSNNKNK